MSSIFIVIEGLDGVGKSTISKHLAESINAVLYRTPPEDYCPIRKLINKCNDRDAQFYYYLSSVFYASSNIKQMLKEGHSVVCDRYYYTTLVTYSDILSNTYFDLKIDEIIQQIQRRFLQPDFAFLLTIDSLEERRKRIKQRSFISSDDLASLEENESKKHMLIYQKFNLTEIAVDGLSIDSIVSEIKYMIAHEERTGFLSGFGAS
jgi:thymidylate kinase